LLSMSRKPSARARRVVFNNRAWLIVTTRSPGSSEHDDRSSTLAHDEMHG
jgi:hypothetical protein